MSARRVRESIALSAQRLKEASFSKQPPNLVEPNCERQGSQAKDLDVRVTTVAVDEKADLDVTCSRVGLQLLDSSFQKAMAQRSSSEFDHHRAFERPSGGCKPYCEVGNIVALIIPLRLSNDRLDLRR